MRFITDDIGAVVQRMRPVNVDYGQPFLDYITNTNKPTNLNLMPYYKYGHRLEIANELLEQDKDKVFKYQKYPLIALRLDTLEPPEGGLTTHSLNIIIVTLTDKNYKTAERFEKVIKPVLAPLYDRFIIELADSGLFTWEPWQKGVPPHTVIVRPYWGTAGQEGNAAHLFNDPLDCIEIRGLEINSKKC